MDQSALYTNLSDAAPTQPGGEADCRVGLRRIGIDFDRALEVSDRFRGPILLNQPEAFLEGQQPVRPGLLGMSKRKGNEGQDDEQGPGKVPMTTRLAGIEMASARRPGRWFRRPR